MTALPLSFVEGALKTCSKCGQSKPLDQFRARKGSRDGRHGWCHDCYRAYYSEASREWRRKNRERQRENDRKRYAANPDLGRARSQRWRDKNRELVNERAREAYRQMWADPEKRVRVLERNHRRRAATAPSPELAVEVAAMYEMPCAYCGATERIQIDHVVPLSHGGKHELSNLVPACASCNFSKKDRPLSEWFWMRQVPA